MSDEEFTHMLNMMTPTTMRQAIRQQKVTNLEAYDERRKLAAQNKAALKEVMGKKEFFLKKKAAKP